MLLKRDSSKQVLPPIEEGGKVQKLATQSDVDEIKRVELDLHSLRIEAKRLRTDFTFL
jgi:CHAD domain-containing protein